MLRQKKFKNRYFATNLFPTSSVHDYVIIEYAIMTKSKMTKSNGFPLLFVILSNNLCRMMIKNQECQQASAH